MFTSTFTQVASVFVGGSGDSPDLASVLLGNYGVRGFYLLHRCDHERDVGMVAALLISSQPILLSLSACVVGSSSRYIRPLHIEAFIALVQQ